MCLLRSIVSQLRRMETSLEFIGDRQVDGRKTQLATGYMKHSFAYGSTFYQSWVQVCSCDMFVSVTIPLHTCNRRAKLPELGAGVQERRPG